LRRLSLDMNDRRVFRRYGYGEAEVAALAAKNII